LKSNEAFPIPSPREGRDQHKPKGREGFNRLQRNPFLPFPREGIAQALASSSNPKMLFSVPLLRGGAWDGVVAGVCL